MAPTALSFFLWPLFLGALGSGLENGHPEVETQYGKLRGKTLSVKETDRNVHAFYGVPFAKSPVGPLRFAAPEPPESWSSVREAQEHAPLCPQNRHVLEQMTRFLNSSLPPLSEDCLYLNIFTPADREKGLKLPVMVFIHGGGFQFGGAGMFEGSALSAYENVVVASIQYRLGFLGFFSTGDKQVPGNYGFLDQVAALRWVKENIADFGGDPNLVTIFGNSAGAVSVSILMISPMSIGLFHRAIAESGVALIPNLMEDKPQHLTSVLKVVSEASSCDSASLLDCLRKKTEDEMSGISESLGHISFFGRVDGTLIPKAAAELLAEKAVAPVPFIVGVNNHEFGYMLPRASNITGLNDGIPRDRVLQIFQKIHLMNVRPEIFSLVMDEYFGNTTDHLKIRDGFLDLCGDVIFVIPALSTANYHRATGESTVIPQDTMASGFNISSRQWSFLTLRKLKPDSTYKGSDSDPTTCLVKEQRFLTVIYSGFPVYFYEFQHRPSLFKNVKPDYVKADHADELFFVVGGPFLHKGVFFAGPDTEEEKTLSKAVMNYWANFARNGNPNGPGLVQWPQYDQNEGFLQININLSAAHKLKAKKYEFWTKTLRQKILAVSRDS